MIHVFKLSTGEELIGTADVSTLDEGFINIEDPLVLLTDISSGLYTLQFLPFMSYCPEKLFTFKSSSIITYSTPSEYLIQRYNEYKRVESDDSGRQEALKKLYDSLFDGETRH